MGPNAVQLLVVVGVSSLFLLGCVGILLLLQRTTSRELRATQMLLGELPEDQ